MRPGPLVWGAAVLVLACQSPTEGPDGDAQDADRCLALRGEDAWEHLRAAGPAVRPLVAARGMPSHLCHVDGGVQLVYLRRDEAVRVSGGSSVQRGIPPELLDLLPERDRRRVEARRAAAPGRSRAGVSRAPAALAPGSDRFDVAALVATLSRKTSFGLAGLQGWQRSALADGGVRATASDGPKRYEVRANRVSVVVTFDTGKPHTVTGAALACRRLNEAIFPRDPQPANDATLELLFAVATEPGQRRFERKISGRTLSAQRAAGRGQVLFAIHPR